MKRHLAALPAVLLVLASCGGADDSTTTTPSSAPPTIAATTSVVPSTGGAPSSTSPSPPPTTAAPPAPTTTETAPTTRDPAPAATAPDHFRYGPNGLFEVIDNVVDRLVPESVETASSDNHGGIVYRYDWRLNKPGTYWLAAEASEPLVREPAFDFFFGGSYQGDPTLFYPNLEPAGECEPEQGKLIGRNLIDGSEHEFMCDVAGGDGGVAVRSYGGELFVGVQWVAIGGTGTDRTIEFWTDSGEPVEIAANPVPETCEPCELRALLSPDGELLAVSVRPDALWRTSPYFTEDGDPGGWWEGSRAVPVWLSVYDMDTGAAIWSVELSAEFGLADFDGRFVVATRSPRRSNGEVESLVYDTAVADTSVALPGRVILRK